MFVFIKPFFLYENTVGKEVPLKFTPNCNEILLFGIVLLQNRNSYRKVKNLDEYRYLKNCNCLYTNFVLKTNMKDFVSLRVKNNKQRVNK